MSKSTLVRHPDDFLTLDSYYLRPLFDKHFNIEVFDPQKNYNPTQHIFITNCLFSKKWITPYYNNGHKYIIDYLWESFVGQKPTVHNNILELKCGNFFYYNESLWYKSLGYNNYKPNKTRKSTFLMLMNLVKPHRDLIFEKIDVKNALYSYVDKGIYIDGDVEHTGGWQRHFNPKWYDDTSYSVVVETTNQPPLFVTEKTFKAIAFFHPFVIWGAPCILKHLRKLGFETFSHIIDEKYDITFDNNTRLNYICEEITKMNSMHHTIFDDKKTQEILNHNHNLFFDESIESKFVCEVIEKMLEFVKS